MPFISEPLSEVALKFGAVALTSAIRHLARNDEEIVESHAAEKALDAHLRLSIYGSAGAAWKDERSSTLLAQATWWLNYYKAAIALREIGRPPCKIACDIGAGAGATAAALLIDDALSKTHTLHRLTIVEPNELLLNAAWHAANAVVQELTRTIPEYAPPELTAVLATAEEFSQSLVLDNDLVLCGWVANNAENLSVFMDSIDLTAARNGTIILFEARRHKKTVHDLQKRYSPKQTYEFVLHDSLGQSINETKGLEVITSNLN